MIQLCIMAMVLGAVLLIALPSRRYRLVQLASKGVGMSAFGVGLAGLVWNLASPLV
ncbi:hypothetical protein H7F51_15630 [Novosphingobium flavum]|uniref:Uncharacterized protein n=1 Tax=Novosphingobium flavum TaxID=1778672 RepID=A0A7X1FTY9_9SPHN|nr:hypothetical protein [Novosphingobium flavum]MBC2666949.1 hypothetical protein [Novosphingobium flavum]